MTNWLLWGYVRQRTWRSERGEGVISTAIAVSTSPVVMSGASHSRR